MGDERQVIGQGVNSVLWVCVPSTKHVMNLQREEGALYRLKKGDVADLDI